MALGAMAVAQARGREVGGDLSVIGFDDIPPAEDSHPPLTTIHQPIYRIATMITAMLIQSLTGETLAERQIILEPRLVPRQSTGPAPSQ
jgi:DNA-binding LacI/PurR family transcriptional regulator